jgi:hypothetical protein|tara:strand:- start:273 stop:995 length:723 start_codon:yes stop_codon:yes gene_type:complete
MDKLSDYFAILKLIEQARKSSRKAGQVNYTLDTGIYNQALSTGMLRGSEGIGGSPASPSEVIDFIPQNKRNPKRAGMEYMSDGGSPRGIGSLLKQILNEGLEVGTANYLGIPKQDTDWASSIGERYGLSVPQRDAARHVALGWLASKTDNPDLAKFFADAREFRPIAGGSVVSRRMDLENNDIGFSLPARSKAEAESMILELVEKGQVNTDDPSGYAMGGEARYDIRRGVGAFAPYTRRA